VPVDVQPLHVYMPVAARARAASVSAAPPIAGLPQPEQRRLWAGLPPLAPAHTLTAGL
jgi:hypothetical protein